MPHTLWIILWLPFLTAGLIAFFLKSRPQAAGIVATTGILACFALSFSLIPVYGNAVQNHLLPYEFFIRWIPLGDTAVEFGVFFNGLTLLMLLIVTGVGALIFLFSMSYMKGDPGYSRYFACLSLFTFSMLGIVLANNLIQVFVFWELVGLSSYLLIGFWFEKPEASTAGKKAFLTTRVGDVGMMIGILMAFGLLSQNGAGSFNFIQLQAALPGANIPAFWMTVMVLCLFLGVAGKSAQMPLHVWLPDAMEGPTPVSALIHAATMVAAGVFLLARLDFLFFASPMASQIIAWTGIITAFLAATMAVVQDDIKKILAYSTLSQLGYMVMALGLHAAGAGMFHLTTHAFFKALLFLGAGSLIHAFHTQNIWEMRTPDLTRKMPVTAVTFLIGTLALMGIPPLSGFYSKEAILAVASHGAAPMFWLALTVVFLTAFYMGRLFVALWLGAKNQLASQRSIHEADWRMQVPLCVLGLFAMGGGFLPVTRLLEHAHTEHAHGPAWLLWGALGLAVAGFVSAVCLYRTDRAGLSSKIKALKGPVQVLKMKYYFDTFYDFWIAKVQENVAYAADLFERYVIVESGVNGTAAFTRFCGDLLRRFQTGSVQFYALLFCTGIAAGLAILILGGRL